MSLLIDNDSRKSKILEASFNEFSKKGYKKASTNQIVRSAGVSKGLLFHYYGNKKQLYLTVYSKVLDYIFNHIVETVNFADQDLLSRLEDATYAYIEIFRSNEKLSNLLANNRLVTDDQILKKTRIDVEQYQSKAFRKLFQKIDYFLFNERIDVNNSLDVIKWTITRVINDWSDSHDFKLNDENCDELSENVNVYLDLFRTAFYK
ncbi:MAG: TetR/AcrR family transcriptional regulator [Candidatus Izimaplasma sp.]|nr:TetR/AcrR family transcriptional regulator [Candidatus Izimaplasma bacterium]